MIRNIETLSINRVPIETLHLDSANARQHNDINMESIIGSLKRFGQAEPLVVQASTGKVIGGNGRLVAMKQLGWTECDIVEIEIDEIGATALGIALNRTAELAEWDNETLAKLLDELRTEDALDGIGYVTDDIDLILAELEEQQGNHSVIEDIYPEPPPLNPVTTKGDLWILGKHKLLCGDSTNKDDLARLMNGEKAALLSTDPPYCVRLMYHVAA